MISHIKTGVDALSQTWRAIAMVGFPSVMAIALLTALLLDMPYARVHKLQNQEHLSIVEVIKINTQALSENQELLEHMNYTLRAICISLQNDKTEILTRCIKPRN